MTGKRPLFLNAGHYRRRRLHDAARLLPVIGIFLCLLPILWAPGQTETRDTAPDGIYLFAVWAALVLAAVLLSRRLAADEARGREGED
ncbi:MAG: hypothetical protein KF887_10995 [Paracoccaceae bacterium]|nr:MAG: hypothetical protein KF887_10995 [Paracoccaceae bacterium]